MLTHYLYSWARCAFFVFMPSLGFGADFFVVWMPEAQALTMFAPTPRLLSRFFGLCGCLVSRLVTGLVCVLNHLAFMVSKLFLCPLDA